MARGFAVVVLVVSCGRSHFDPIASDASDASDAVVIDALPAGLIVWFPLEDGASTTFADVASGHPGTCTPPACPAATAGHRGQGLLFDGSSDCITVTDAGQANPLHLTMSLWMRADLAANATMLARRVDIGPTTTRDTWQLEMFLDRSFAFTFTVNAVEQQISSPAGALSISAWHHVAATSTARSRCCTSTAWRTRPVRWPGRV